MPSLVTADCNPLVDPLHNTLFCPGCARQTFIKHPPNKFQCTHPDCGFTVYGNVAAGAAAIIETASGIIMVRRAKQPGQGMLDLPGGFVDVKESLETAVIREVHEELGLHINGLRYLCSFPNTYPYQGLVYHTIDSFFLAQADSLNITLQPQEVTDFELIHPSQLDLDLIAFPSVKNAVAFYLEKVTRACSKE